MARKSFNKILELFIYHNSAAAFFCTSISLSSSAIEIWSIATYPEKNSTQIFHRKLHVPQFSRQTRGIWKAPLFTSNQRVWIKKTCNQCVATHAARAASSIARESNLSIIPIAGALATPCVFLCNHLAISRLFLHHTLSAPAARMKGKLKMRNNCADEKFVYGADSRGERSTHANFEPDKKLVIKMKHAARESCCCCSILLPPADWSGAR